MANKEHGIKVGSVVRLNSGSKLRMSVRKVKKEEATCQWIVGESVRSETFHVSQLVLDGEFDSLTTQGLGAFVLLSMADMTAGGLNEAVKMVSEQDRGKIEKFAIELRNAVKPQSD